MKILLFNGPPSCGKDTAAQTIFHSELAKEVPVIWERMAFPIKRAFAGAVGVPCDAYGNVYPYENEKDTVVPFLGVTYRQWQIEFSEKFMKPLYGQEVFGKLFIRRLHEWRLRHGDEAWAKALCLVPDCGFEIERQTLENFDVTVVRVLRPNCTFALDSRSYLDSPHVILQNSDLDIYKAQVLALAQGLSKQQ